MEKMFRNFSNPHPLWFVVILALITALVSQSFAQTSTSGSGRGHVQYAIYFTSEDVDHLLADSVQFAKTLAYFAPIKPYKVYLEGRSEGEIDVAMMKKISDKFRSMGIKTWGSMVPVGHNGPSVYNNPDDMASLQKRMKALAKVFDYIILDDWLFTTATDEKSVKDRGDQSWGDYRTRLILQQSKKYIIDAAKEVNPNAKVIIKYPNWYEGHRQNGYDVYHETLQFDNMAVGIETRNRMTHDQHIPIYSGYIFQKWFSSVDPSKWVGSWLDNYDMKGDDNDYVAQVWQAVLAQTPEVILWCAGQLYPDIPASDVYPHFIEMLPEFDRVAGMLNGQSRGVPIYLPYGSTGEYNIFGYLGMAGIPLTPVAQFPTEGQNAIFTLHSLQDPKLAEELLGRLKDGHDVFMTWGLWKKLQGTEFKNTLCLMESEGSVASSQFRVRIGWDEQLYKADKAFSFPRIETSTWPYVRDVAVEQDDYDYGVLLEAQYLKGTMYVLNMPENSYDLLRFPVPVLNAIRRPFAKDLGMQLDGPGGVSMYMFGTKQYALYNMSDQAAPLSLRFEKKIPSAGWIELVHGKHLSISEDTTYVRFDGPVISTVGLTLQPFEIAVVQAP
ncbi:MAG TPA: hypothetical protein VMF88_15170 [Bacteroidota bacterium]|nr:hypothetical protein [Bacteroidota bacterium]